MFYGEIEKIVLRDSAESDEISIYAKIIEKIPSGTISNYYTTW